MRLLLILAALTLTLAGCGANGDPVPHDNAGASGDVEIGVVGEV